MQNRRKFLLQSSLAAGAVAFLKPLNTIAANSSNYFKKLLNSITVFHTNDLHGQLSSCANGIGGLNNVMHTMHNNTNGILLDAGDFLDEKLSLPEHIETIKAMNQTGYKAVTIGNHDIARGQQYLAELSSAMNFSLVNCNYEFSNEALRDKVKTYTIVKHGRFKVGVTGVGVNLNSSLKQKEKIICNHPYSSASIIAKYLKEVENCDMVICLSHLGSNKKSGTLNNFDFAAKSKNIDVIIGGHGRTMQIASHVMRNKEDKEIFISQAGWKGLMVGKLEFTFNEYGKNGFANKSFIPGLSAGSNVYSEYQKLIA